MNDRWAKKLWKEWTLSKRQKTIRKLFTTWMTCYTPNINPSHSEPPQPHTSHITLIECSSHLQLNPSKIALARKVKCRHVWWRWFKDSFWWAKNLSSVQMLLSKSHLGGYRTKQSLTPQLIHLPWKATKLYRRVPSKDTFAECKDTTAQPWMQTKTQIIRECSPRTLTPSKVAFTIWASKLEFFPSIRLPSMHRSRSKPRKLPERLSCALLIGHSTRLLDHS